MLSYTTADMTKLSSIQQKMIQRNHLTLNLYAVHVFQDSLTLSLVYFYWGKHTHTHKAAVFYHIVIGFQKQKQTPQSACVHMVWWVKIYVQT